MPGRFMFGSLLSCWLVRRSNHHRHLHFHSAISICYDNFSWLARRLNAHSALHHELIFFCHESISQGWRPCNDSCRVLLRAQRRSSIWRAYACGGRLPPSSGWWPVFRFAMSSAISRWRPSSSFIIFCSSPASGVFDLAEELAAYSSGAIDPLWPNLR